MSKVAIRLTGVGKKYSLGRGAHFSAASGNNFWAIRDVNLVVNRGDRVGIVGPNGAGKTTLLRVIAGIIKPSNGRVTVQGRVAALMDLEAGFHPDLSGTENVYINGLLTGMTCREIDNKYDWIIDFAGIGGFINLPFRTYSSGMKFRLALAVAMASECDILILDEIFLAGDFDFQLKTVKLIRGMQKRKDITMVICSHAPTFIWNLADRFYVLKSGILSQRNKRGLLDEIDEQHAVWTKAFQIRYKSLTKRGN